MGEYTSEHEEASFSAPELQDDRHDSFSLTDKDFGLDHGSDEREVDSHSDEDELAENLSKPDAIIDQRLDSDEELLRLRKELRDLHTSKGFAEGKLRDEERALVDEIKQKTDHIILEVQKKLGIFLSREPEEDAHDEEAERIKRLEEFRQSLSGHEEDEEFLTKAGFMKEGRFQFPRHLFSRDVRRLWNRYIELVRQDVTLREMFQYDRIEPKDIHRIDQMRVEAHDNATNAILHELGLEPTQENFDRVRSLVAKMRDLRIPNAGEARTTASAAMSLLSRAKEANEEAA